MRPAPVEVGEVVELFTTENRNGGPDPVGHYQGFVVFVRGAEPGQSVRAKVERVGPTYGVASVVGVIG